MPGRLARLLTGVLIMTSGQVQAETETRLITDFTSQSDELGWFVVNDDVMGGRSDGDFRIDGGTLDFAGRTNTRGGGFSSVRSRGPRVDLSDFEGIRLRVKGDGRRYTWQLRTNARFRGRDVSYWAEFDTVDEQWVTVDLPFTGFVPKFRGVELAGGPPDPSRIRGMGLMINDGKDGNFDLSLDRVEAYSATKPFTLASYRWENRVLIISSADRNDHRLQQIKSDVERSHQGFDERDMVLVELLGDGQGTVGGRSLTDADVDALRSELDIAQEEFAIILLGKDGREKLRKDEIATMSDIFALIDSMPMRRSEMRHEDDS